MADYHFNFYRFFFNPTLFLLIDIIILLSSSQLKDNVLIIVYLLIYELIFKLLRRSAIFAS